MPDQITAPWFAAFFVTVIVMLLALLWGLFRWKASTHEAASMFQAVLTGAAILVAGYWYLVERRGTPHADLSQTLTVIRGDGNFAVVEATLTLKNLGSILLKVKHVDIRLQRAFPSGLDLEEVARSEFNVWPDRFSDSSKMYHDTELQWPTLRLYRSSVNYEVEPGESDIVTTTFVVSCDVKQVRVAAEVMKDEGMWWKARTFASTETACAPNQTENRR